MINIAFWNIHNNENIINTLQEFIVEYNCDIVVLAETGNIDLQFFCDLLSLKNKDFYEVKQIAYVDARIKIIADKSLRFQCIRDGIYYSIFNIEYFEKEFLLTSIHLQSKTNAQEKDQSAVVRNIVKVIQETEKETQNKNTIIIGDFNANPFESVCIDADCFHAIPNAEISKKMKRTVNYIEYEMFYNPMWNFFGDKNAPYGTYHYNSSKIQNFYWNIFDQVMFRPNMLNSVDLNSLKIITSIGDKSLLNRNGIPNKTKFSDHLPIYFTLKEENLK